MNNPTYPGDERRRGERLRPANSEARVACQRGELFLGPNVATSLVDVSESGLGIRTRELLVIGERVSVSLDGIGTSIVQRLGRVAWCAPADGGGFRAGVELDAPLEYAELIAIGGY
jgi:hypothetical protein